jgi:hypothetical protein
VHATSGSRRIRRIVAVTAVISVALTAVVLWSVATMSSVPHAIGYYLRGETLIVDSAEKSFGTINAGDRVTVTFRLVNRGRESVRIVGRYSPCRCLALDDFPLTMGPGEIRDLAMRVRVDPELTGPESIDFLEKVTLFTSKSNQSLIPLWVKGSVQMRGSVPESSHAAR